MQDAKSLYDKCKDAIFVNTIGYFTVLLLYVYMFALAFKKFYLLYINLPAFNSF